MKPAKYIINTAKSIYRSIRRFPVSIALSSSFAILMIIISEIRASVNMNTIQDLERICMILALGFPLSVSIKLFFERKEHYKNLHIILAFVSEFLILFLYYFSLLKDFRTVSVTRYAGVSLSLYLILVFIQYFKDRENYELYIMKIIGRFFITVIYSAVLFAGLSAILATIDRLLGVRVPSDFYYYTFLIIAGIFAPTYYLGGFPSKYDELSKENYSNIFKVLILYIVIPLISIYTLILYIYFAKIIITASWPVGLVSHLVLWYSVISAAVLFFATPIIDDNQFAYRFMRIFPKLIIPLLLLMFVSIGIRVNAYGITENRYYVIALSIWVLGVMIYFSLAKHYKNIFLPVTFAIIILISVLGGPLSSYSVSIFSQNQRFKKLLSKNNMIQNNKIIQNSSISEKDKNEISSIIFYFNSTHKLSDIRLLPENAKMQNMNDILGFPVSYANIAVEENFYFSPSQIQGPLNIAGYNYMFDSRNNENISNAEFNMNYDHETNILKVSRSNKVIYTKDMKDIANKLITKYGFTKNAKEINQSDMTFEDENSNIKVKIFIFNIFGTKNSSGILKINELNYFILFNIK